VPIRPNFRFWGKIAVGNDDDCWNWRGSPNPSGYGTFNFDGQNHNAHRVAWILTNGSIPSSGTLVCHKCDNRLCCNPAHLFLGTYKDNREDSIRKGRRTEINGHNNPRFRIPYETVCYIRKLGNRDVKHAHIAELLNVSRSQVTKIINGQQRRTS